MDEKNQQAPAAPESSPKKRSNLVTRVISAIVLLPVVLAIILWGNHWA